MITQALEFYRLANAQPQHGVIERRSEAAEKLAAKLVVDTSHKLLLAAVQGVVLGFDKAPLNQESPIVAAVVESIKSNDLGLPESLTENANDLRAVSAMALKSILDGKPSRASTIAAMSLRTALSMRQPSSNRYLKWVLETLLQSADLTLSVRGASRRKATQTKMDELLSLDPPEEEAEVWETLVPALQGALKELSAQAAVDREELNMLWWMFTAYSSIAKKALDQSSPAEIATVVGLELAELSLLPATPNSSEMVKRTVVRSVSTGEQDVSLKTLCSVWTEPMRAKIIGHKITDGNIADKVPAVLPLSKAVASAADGGTKTVLDKNFSQATGFSLAMAARADDWAAQIFRETVLKRYLNAQEEI